MRNGNDHYHGLQFNPGMNGVYLFGWNGGVLGTKDMPHSLTWDWNGNVGIRSNLLVDSSADNNGTTGGSLRFGGWSGEAIGSKRTAGGNQYGLDFYTNNTNRLAVDFDGNVGIGTTDPLQRLDVNGNVNIRANLFLDVDGANNGTINNSLRFGAGSGECIGSKRTAGGNQYGLDFYTNSANRLAITFGGNVGIGTTTPASKLEVNGETKTNSLKVGNNGTSISVVQKGTFTIGSSATAFKTVTFNFPNAFTSTPVLVVTVKNDPGWNVGDTFVASIRSVNATTVTFNILRVDSAVGWSQNLLLEWIAVQ